MTEIISALGPVFLTIALGAVLKRIGLPGDHFWPLAERITYYILFPALLITATAGGGFAAEAAIPMAASLTGTILLLALALLAARPALPFSGPGFSSVFQGGLRYNTFVAMAAVGALYGDEGLALAGIAVAAMVPLLNLLSVAVVAWFGDGNGAVGMRAIVKLVVTNPLIVACAIGIFLGASGLRLPEVAGDTLTILGRASLPLALLAVGAALDPTALRRAGSGMIAASAVKLAAMPALAALLFLPFDAPATARAVAILFAACPSATSGYILARQLGGDAEMLAATITVSTVAAALTMPLALALLG